MRDVRKALEAAERAIYDTFTKHYPDAAAGNAPAYETVRDAGAGRIYPCLQEEARAAVLAFLRAMPEYYDLGGLRVQWEIPDLAAAVEKETQL